MMRTANIFKRSLLLVQPKSFYTTFLKILQQNNHKNIFDIINKCSIKVDNERQYYRKKYDSRLTPDEILATLTKEDAKLLADIQEEYNYLKLVHKRNLPRFMSNEQWIPLLMAINKYSRLCIYKCLHQKEKENHFLTSNTIFRRDLMSYGYKKTEENRSNDENINIPGIIGDCNWNQWEYFYHKFLQHRGFNGIRWGQPLIFDLSFENSMPPYQIFTTMKNFYQIYQMNSFFRDPFHLMCYGAQFDDLQMHLLKSYLNANLHDFPLDHYPLTINSVNYLDHYPTDQLVYINELSVKDVTKDKWDPETVFIVPVTEQQPQLSYRKAVKEGIRIRSIPLDRFVNNRFASRTLKYHLTVNILRAVKDNEGDWGQAIIQNFPQNFIIQFKNKHQKEFSKLLDTL